MEQAKGELVPGGLAVIVGAFACVENIGRLVVLERFIEPNQSVFMQDGYFDADYQGLWVVSGDDLHRNTEEGIVISNLGAHIPAHLTPINPEADPLETTKERDLCLTQ